MTYFRVRCCYQGQYNHLRVFEEILLHQANCIGHVKVIALHPLNLNTNLFLPLSILNYFHLYNLASAFFKMFYKIMSIGGGTRQFGAANLSASQFGRKINKNDLSSLALKRQQKSFVMSQRQLKRQL